MMQTSCRGCHSHTRSQRWCFCRWRRIANSAGINADIVTCTTVRAGLPGRPWRSGFANTGRK